MEQIKEYTNNGKWIAITTLIWNEVFKQLILSCMNEPDFIIKFANPANYCIYWIKLTKFMAKYYDGKTPEKPDKFIFLLLLTYPKSYILQLKSFLQLKIAFNELNDDHNNSDNSDFTCASYRHDDENDDSHTCICSQPIENVFEFENNLSGVCFNVGSVCNKRHRVISENDEQYKLMQRAARDRKDEIKNGWPQGYKENQRSIKKQQRTEKNKSRSSSESETESINYTINNRCIMCQKDKIIYSPTNSSSINGICSCVPNKIKKKSKKLNKQILKEIQTISCLNCKQETRKLKNNKLCSICIEIKKIDVCLKCKIDFTAPINTDPKFCNDCISKVRNCLDCDDYIMSPETYKTRCADCFKQNKQSQKHIYIECIECSDDVLISETDKEWRKSCSSCFLKTKGTCEKCSLSVKILVVKKEGPNKGKKFYKCEPCGFFKWV
jgi:hypothetical protein